MRDGLVEEGGGGRNGGERGVDPRLAEQGSPHAELLAVEDVAGERELGAVIGGRDLADHPQIVLAPAVAQVVFGRRSLHLRRRGVVVPVDDRHLAGGREQRALLVRDGVERAETFGVRRGDERQDADVG